jgi:hypothetical protein
MRPYAKKRGEQSKRKDYPLEEEQKKGLLIYSTKLVVRPQSMKN